MKALILIVALIAPFFARADTIDRIQQCRASGQTSCIFDLLIEMDAKIRDGNGHRNLLDAGYYTKTSGGCCNTFQVHSHSSSHLRITLCNSTYTYACQNGTNCTVDEAGQIYRIEVTGRNTFRSITSMTCDFVKQ